MLSFARRAGILLAATLAVAGLFESAALAQTRQPLPPGARSPLSPPETNRVQAEEFRRGYEAYVRGEYERAAAIWTRLADQGHVKSMNNLGTMYAQGKGVSRNYSLALVYYRRAAARTDARAMYNIGIAYEFGRGVEKSDAQAADWYRKAATRGLVEGMTSLAWILSTSPDIQVRDGTRAIRWANAALRQRTTSKILSTLAAAHAEAGEYRQAVVAIERAIDFLKRETNGADMAMSERELFGLLRQQGRTDDLVDLLERLEFYRNGQPTRD